MNDTVRLTQLSHKGGCGCKISPTVLRTMLSKAVPSFFPKELLVGTETSDDAAVFQINENQAIVATTDFFMPIVDDPFDFGTISATNAISDVYAMGGTPLFALAIVGMPINTLPVSQIKKILEGGESACARAGIVVAGGHSIDSLEPIYGLCVVGLVDPKNLKRNIGARAGDKIILGKNLGIGIYCSALKKGNLSEPDYKELISVMTQLNVPGVDLSKMEGVHALTDVTGFGLLGHLLEICNGSNLGARIELDKIPFLSRTREFAEQGFVTGASSSNWASYSERITNSNSLSQVHKNLLSDPQTSGGLLVACSEKYVDEALKCFKDKGMTGTVIGEFVSGTANISVN